MLIQNQTFDRVRYLNDRNVTSIFHQQHQQLHVIKVYVDDLTMMLHLVLLLIDNMDHVLVIHNHLKTKFSIFLFNSTVQFYLYKDMVDLMVRLMMVDLLLLLVDMVLVGYEFLFDQTWVQQVYSVPVVI